jgi:hypothetical protein
MSINIPIIPKYVVRNFTFHKLEIQEVVVIPFQSAKITVALSAVDEQNTNQVTYKTIEMAQSEYMQWLNDDSYLVSFVLSKLEFSKQL